MLNVVDFEKLSTADLIAEIKRFARRFVFDTHVAVDVVNIAAAFYLDRARKVLSADAIDPSSLLGLIPETHEARAIAEINAAATKSRRWLLSKTSVTAPCSTMNWPSRAMPRISTRSTA